MLRAERRTSIDQERDLLNRLMARNFQEYTVGKYNLAQTSKVEGEARGRKVTETVDDYLSKFNSMEEVMQDLEDRGITNRKIVPVI
jgi:hypothetical protein